MAGWLVRRPRTRLRNSGLASPMLPAGAWSAPLPIAANAPSAIRALMLSRNGSVQNSTAVFTRARSGWR